MDQTASIIKSTKMRPRARLIALLGEELISDEPVALVELVKNSYDADASHVEVRFNQDDSGTFNEIVVSDDGIGMDLKTVLEGWFEPGTIFKRKKEESPSGRILQGAKGIGRFAAARLAELMYLESKKRRAQNGVCVLLDWQQFDEKVYLDEVSVEYEERYIPNLKNGTILTLCNLRKDWTEEDFDELYYRLSRLISPFKEISGFSISLRVPGLHSGNVEPPEFILEPEYYLKGLLDNEGYFSGEIHAKRKAEKIPKRKLGDAGSFPFCGSFEVEIRAWDRERDDLEPIAEKTDLTITEIRRILTSYSGVSIYRDGFRVHPYGQA